MIDHYKVITFTHHLVDIADIGKYQIKEAEPGARVGTIVQELGIEEWMYLNTCNRVSYVIHTRQVVDYDFITRLIRLANPEISQEDLDQIDRYVSLYEGLEAVQHVFEVAGSIDSLVVGESEIFRQFRNAYLQAQERGYTGDKLRLLENMAVQVAKRIYSHTRINEKPLSIAALAGQTIIEKDLPADARILLVGAGETNTLVGKFLHKHRYHNMVVYNRSEEKAKELAATIEGKAHGLSDLVLCHHFDAMVVCTGAQEAIVTQPIFKNMLNGHGGRRLLIDLAVPANVDKEVALMDEVEYVNIDQLKALADKNLNFRRQEISIAKTIVEEALEEFKTAYTQRQIELALSDLPEEIRKVKQKITEEVFRQKLENFSPNQLEVLEEILGYMEAKCIGIPMKLAKKTVK
ncbi:MAG: glutamyl-tRNA reductase [Saprospiraceae bacterium]|nr:glutamyl-tRNA reductase [Saprospiraceae bacterium]